MICCYLSITRCHRKSRPNRELSSLETTQTQPSQALACRLSQAHTSLHAQKTNNDERIHDTYHKKKTDTRNNTKTAIGYYSPRNARTTTTTEPAMISSPDSPRKRSVDRPNERTNKRRLCFTTIPPTAVHGCTHRSSRLCCCST